METELYAPKKGKIFVKIAALLLIIIALVGIFWMSPLKEWLGGDMGWQAVFLTNGQVYFGHLQPSLSQYAKFTNIYYLQVTQQLQPTTGETVPDIRLVKLGGELHGPTDVMYISRNQILFWEYLKPDSRVVQGIRQLEAQQ